MNKLKYFFILGNNPTLSSAEIISLLKIDQNQAIVDDDFLITSLNENIDPKYLMSVLGGTIKVGIVDFEYLPKLFRFDVKKMIDSLKIQAEQKFYFGFSLYGENIKSLVQIVRKVGMQVKKGLAEKGVKSRWVISKEEVLSSVIVQKNKLVSDQGVEWCVLKGEDKIYLGRTLAVQEFEEYGKRDFGRPARDAKSGMLPPKLAKMMINIARRGLENKKLTLLDPFCGSGTVLQESLILGIEKNYGSDLSAKAVTDSKENLKWLGENISNKADWNVVCHDVKNLSEIFKEKMFDLIVAEGFLGSPMKGGESQDFIDKTVRELSGLYISAFSEFIKVLKDDGVVCMAWPVFMSGDHESFLPIYDKILKIGFKQAQIFNDDFKKNTSIRLSDRGTIVYGRTDQKVYREIVVFKTIT